MRMVRFAAIVRWTPETARAVRERYDSIVKRTAPKAVLDAFAKVKWITQEISLPNHLAIMVFEVEEKDLLAIVPLPLYMGDVCTEEEYQVMTFEDYVAASEKLPLEKIPKPESWTK
jgi:hypothetical protein